MPLILNNGPTLDYCYEPFKYIVRRCKYGFIKIESNADCDDSLTLSLLCVCRRSRGRNYEAELQRCRPEAAPVEFGDYHPLKPIMVANPLLSPSYSSSVSSSHTPPLS